MMNTLVNYYMRKRIVCILSLVLAFLLPSMSVYAVNADDLYRNGDYHKAIEQYQKELKDGATAALYHNLGSSYYRVDNIPMAVLYYEKAYKMDPSDNAIKHSLEIARSKTIDRMPPESEMFFLHWYKVLVSMNTVDIWAYYAIGSLVAALLLFLVFLFVDKMLLKRISFYSFVVLLLCFILCNIFAWQKYEYVHDNDTAIIMSPIVNVKSSPTTKSADACLIHEGTWVRIIDKDINDWYGIRLSDGREGWIKSKELKEI